MADKDKQPIVVINYKAQCLSYYDSIKDFIITNGFSRSGVYQSYRARRTYKCMMLIPEQEYKERWLNGTLDQLRFKTRKERIADKVNRLKEFRDVPEVENERRRKLSEHHKKLAAQGKDNGLNAARIARRTPVKCITTGVVYKSCREASEVLGIHVSHISRSCRKGYTTFGLRFKYVKK